MHERLLVNKRILKLIEEDSRYIEGKPEKKIEENLKETKKIEEILVQG